jgi:hypothetical protein
VSAPLAAGELVCVSDLAGASDGMRVRVRQDEPRPGDQDPGDRDRADRKRGDRERSDDS